MLKNSKYKTIWNNSKYQAFRKFQKQERLKILNTWVFEKIPNEMYLENFKSKYVYKFQTQVRLKNSKCIIIGKNSNHWTFKKFYSSLFGKLPETQTATPKQLLRTMTGQLLPFIHYSKQETSQKKV